jgi:hypothetical protein
MTAVADVRIVEAGTIKLNEVMTQVIPELMYDAAKAIKNHDLVAEKYPEHVAELNKMLDLRLHILKETYLCDKIQDRINGIKRETAKTVIAWAKDKSFGPMLGKDGLVDMKKARTLALSKGKDYVMKAITEYNEQLVPFANKTSGPQGDWSAEEKAQATALQNLQREHNAIATKMKVLIK